MAARGSDSKRRGARRSGRSNPIDDALAKLERDLPRLLRQLRGNVRDMQRQVERARADGEKRWQDAERKLKRDAAQFRGRLEAALARVRGKRKPKAGRASGRGARRTTSRPGGRGKARSRRD